MEICNLAPFFIPALPEVFSDATNRQAVVIAFDMPHAADPRNLHPADNLVIGVIAVLVNKQLVESSLALLA